MYGKEIKELFANIKKDIDKEQRRKQIRASGESAASLTDEIDRDGKGGRLMGRAYFEQQEYGRGPTTGTGDGAVLRGIFRWLSQQEVKRKWRGVFPTTPQEVSSLAWAITTSIHKRGTKRGKDPSFPGLDITGILKKRKPVFIVAVRGNTLKLVSDILRDIDN